jgi:hypothetical protein
LVGGWGSVDADDLPELVVDVHVCPLDDGSAVAGGGLGDAGGEAAVDVLDFVIAVAGVGERPLL